MSDYSSLSFYFLLFVSCVISYLLGYLFKEVNFKNIKNYLLDRSFIITSLIFLISLLLLNGAVQEAAFTFSSVYLGFWLGGEMDKRAEKQKLKIYLGLIWQELRYNLYQLEQIKLNYRFNVKDLKLFPINFIRFNNVYFSTNGFKNDTYQSYLFSGAVTTLASNILKNPTESDKLFTNIEAAYTDLEHLKSFFSFIRMDFETKLRIQNDVPDILKNSDLTSKAIIDIETKIKKVATEIAISYRTCLIAIDNLNEILNDLNVKLTESTFKNEVLIQEDKDFIKSALVEIPKNVVENPFQT